MNITNALHKWWHLGAGKFQNGLGLNTIVLFDAIAHTDYSNLTVENVNETLYRRYDFKFNSATLSRNNDNLMYLGLIKLKESATDRRYKDIILTEKGKEFARMMNVDGERVLKMVRK